MLPPLSEAVSRVLSEQHRLAAVSYFGLLLVVTFLVRRLRQWQRLRHIKGPRLAGFSRWFWLVPVVRSGELPTFMRELESKYGRDLTPRDITADILSCSAVPILNFGLGRIARVGPNTLVTSDWKLWRRVMSVRSPYRRSERFKGFRLNPTKDHIVSVTDEKEHSRLRSIMIHGVCLTFLLTFSHY
jgi:hypothetical protein